MFSSFSFGKIIKTVLPGIILTLALFLFLEAFWAVAYPDEGSLLKAVPAAWITPVTAALIPVTMILGFFLNTFTWRVVNRRMRKRSDAMLDQTVYAALRSKLSDHLWQQARGYFDQNAPPFPVVEVPDRPPLEYFYLSRIKLTNLNYLWESYFCWYEFDVNSACALLLLGPAAAFLVIVKYSDCLAMSVITAIVLLALTWLAYQALLGAALHNLCAYERNLMLLITGALAEAPLQDAAAADEELDET